MTNLNNKHLILALSLMLGGCGTAVDPGLEDNTNNATADTDKPFVQSLKIDNATISSGASNIDPLFNTLSLTFNEDLATFDANAALTLTANGSPVNGTWSYDNSGSKSTATFTRTGAGLPLNTRIDIGVDSQLKDLNGNAIGQVSYFVTTLRELSLNISAHGLANPTTDLTLSVQYGSGNPLVVHSTPTINYTGSNVELIPASDKKLWLGRNYSLTITGQPAGQHCRFENTSIANTTGMQEMGDSNKYVNLHCSSVTPYAENAARWSDYLKTSLDGSTISTEACPPYDTNEAAYINDYRCVHAGEIRQYTFDSADAGSLTCSTLKVYDVAKTDNLGQSLSASLTNDTTLPATAMDTAAFDWTCSESTGVITVTSRKLKQDKGLIDLISYDSTFDVNAFLNNRRWDFQWIDRKVVITDASDIIRHQTGYTKWWSNPFSEVGGNTNFLGVENYHIYMITDNVSSNLNLGNSSHVSITTVPPVPGKDVGNRTVSNKNTIISTGSGSLIYTNFLWLEANLVGRAAGAPAANQVADHTIPTLEIYNMVHSVIRNTNVSNGLSNYVYVDDGSGTGLYHTTDTGSGIGINNSFLNRFENITSFSNQGAGMIVSRGSQSNRFDNIRLTNNHREGLLINNQATVATQRNRFTNIISANNGISDGIHPNSIAGDGIKLDTGADNNYLAQIKSFNNLQHGVNVSGDNNTLSFITSTSNNKDGFNITGTDNLVLHGTSHANTGDGIVTQGTNKLESMVSVENNGVEIRLNTDYAGLTPSQTPPVTIAYYDDTGTLCSDLNTTTDCSTLPAATATAFAVPTADTGNTFSSLSTSLWATTNGAQTWGHATQNHGRCLNDVVNYYCGLYDQTLLDASTDYDYTGDINTSATHTDTTGTLTTTYNSGQEETTGDYIGNDNGLCEAGEACTAAVKFGSVQ